MTIKQGSSSSISEITQHPHFSFYLLGFFAALLIVGTQIVYPFGISGWDFRNNLWGPAHLLLQNESPYRIELLFDGSNSVWLPWSIGGFFAIGALPFQLANRLWLAVNLAAYCLLLGIVLATVQQRRRVLSLWYLFVACLMIIFPALYSHIALGQITILSVLFLLVAVWLACKQHNTFTAGAFVVLASAKPQISILVIIGLIMRKWTDKSFIARFILSLAAWSFAFSVPLWLMYPDWIPGFMDALSANPHWRQPSSLASLQMLLGAHGFGVWLLMFTISLMIVGFVWRTRKLTGALFWTLAFTPLISPYFWSWDFLVFVPFWVYVGLRAHNTRTRLIWFIIYFITVAVMISIRLSTDNVDQYYIWVPWVVLIGNTLLLRQITSSDVAS